MIALDRVAHLNALSLEMVQGIHQQLETWSDGIECKRYWFIPIAQKRFVQVVIFVIYTTATKQVSMIIEIILQPNMQWQLHQSV